MDPFELIGYAAATLATLAFVPQVVKSYRDKSTKDISLVMYLVFFTGVVLWLIYGIHLESMPMIIANTITALLALSIIILKIKHK
ncbi:MAG: SemiSWEET transporter [Flavobacteriaceae bacterium]|jgi:MtN3 and saliva related transmembrane protein|nr:SemiSWEET transporter [Flavobacteriaceae bacterium]NVJ72004.1 SemiSWEET transporter [Flavobacteriaceae bacterium]